MSRTKLKTRLDKGQAAALWREVAVGDLGPPLGRAFATGPFGSSIGRKFFTEAGVPVIRGSNLSTDVGQRLIHDGLVFVSEEKCAEHKRSVAVPGDLVFTCWGTIGQVGFIDKEGPFQRYLISNKQMKLTPDPKAAVGLFLYYLMSSPQVMDVVQRQSIGAAVPGFNLGQLREMRVRIPDVPTQQRIAAFLRAFDDLIEINERRIKLLEDLVRSLYGEWFVRFKFETVPELPPRTTIGELAEPLRGSMSPSRQPDADFEHFSLPAFDAGRIPIRESGAGIKSNKTTLPGECVLMSKLNPRIARVWFAVPETAAAIASTEFLPWRGASVSNAWLWAAFSSDDFRRRLVGAAGGTSTSHQRVKPNDVASYSIPQPSSEALRAFDAVAEPAIHEVVVLRRANWRLAATRDLLLPRLVTGRLDISDIDLGVFLAEAEDG